jgi:serine protease Do
LRDLPRIVADAPVGKEVEVVIVRKGKEITKKVTLGRLEDGEKRAAVEKEDSRKKEESKKDDSRRDDSSKSERRRPESRSELCLRVGI